MIIRKIIELYHQSYNLIEKPVITFKNPDAFQNYPETFLKNTNAQVLLFFLQSSRYVSNEQSCLKTTGLYDDLLLLSNLFHFFYFMFNDPILFSLCSLISPSFFFDVLSKAFINYCRKAFLYIYVNLYNICLRKLMKFCRNKKL